MAGTSELLLFAAINYETVFACKNDLGDPGFQKLDVLRILARSCLK